MFGWEQVGEQLRCLSCCRVIDIELANSQLEFDPKKSHLKHCVYVNHSKLVQDILMQKLQSIPVKLEEAKAIALSN